MIRTKLGGARASWSRKGFIICHLKIRWSIKGELETKLEEHGGEKGLWKYKLDKLEQLLKETPIPERKDLTSK
jgi:hypothetical protein